MATKLPPLVVRPKTNLEDSAACDDELHRAALVQAKPPVVIEQPIFDTVPAPAKELISPASKAASFPAPSASASNHLTDRTESSPNPYVGGGAKEWGALQRLESESAKVGHRMSYEDRMLRKAKGQFACVLPCWDELDDGVPPFCRGDPHCWKIFNHQHPLTNHNRCCWVFGNVGLKVCVGSYVLCVGS